MIVAGVSTGVGFSNLKNSRTQIRNQKFWKRSGVGVWKNDSGHLWSVSGCKLTILPDIQPANRIVTFSGKLLLYCWCAALFCCAEWHYVFVVLANIAYFMGGQLVFDWDRLENFLVTCDRPVGSIATNTKCQSWVSHVHMQCTIALVSDAQTERKVSVTPKSWLPCNDRKTYYNTFAASADLAYGQPSQEVPNNIRDQPIDG